MIADVSSDGLFVPTDRVHEKPTGPEVLPHEVPLALSIDPGQVRARWIALLPLMYPTTCDTASTARSPIANLTPFFAGTDNEAPCVPDHIV